MRPARLHGLYSISANMCAKRKTGVKCIQDLTDADYAIQI